MLVTPSSHRHTGRGAAQSASGSISTILRDIIQNQLKLDWNDGSEDWYLPEERLPSLITEEAIMSHLWGNLQVLGFPQKKDLVRTIAKDSRRAFATAVMIKLDGDTIFKLFYELKFSDAMLPIGLDDPSMVIALLGDAQANQFRKNQFTFLHYLWANDYD
ncbi:hypothetical protein RRF57_013259 [Xylaria bambusicola]|uniref:Uncharacterized protein n=1 Tax=Xylaria bambusicola TaxID=326684 RepID=A0AAN7V538_9PEZI